MINITPNAIDDITEYYYNVMKAYPNTWDITDVYYQIDKVTEDIRVNAEDIVRRLSIIHGQVQSPLLIKMQKDGMVEAFAKKTRWQFTLRYDSSSCEYYVDNAVKGDNMSNRAYRRGSASPNMPLSTDDRSTQAKMWESIHINPYITERQLKQIISESIRKVLNI